MAKKLEDLKNVIQESFQDGYESEKYFDNNIAPVVSQNLINPTKKMESEVIKNDKYSLPKNNKLNKEKKVKEVSNELKSKRLNLLIKPSLYDDISKIAWVNDISTNEQIGRCLEEFQKRNEDKVNKYNEFHSLKKH